MVCSKIHILFLAMQSKQARAGQVTLLIALDLWGDNETYEMHVRWTAGCTVPVLEWMKVCFTDRKRRLHYSLLYAGHTECEKYEINAFTVYWLWTYIDNTWTQSLCWANTSRKSVIILELSALRSILRWGRWTHVLASFCGPYTFQTKLTPLLV